MKQLHGMNLPQSWEDLTIKQYSDYNKYLTIFSKDIEPFDEEDENTPTKILIEEIKLNFNIIKSFSGLTEDEAMAVDISIAKEYAEALFFLAKPYAAKDVISFTYKDVEYNFPANVGLETKFGQYVESLQAEMAASHLDKDSILYLSHQLAHIVEYDNQSWDGLTRDKLAKEFESIPASVAFEFSFFLSKKSLIYRLAYLEYETELQVRSLPFMKRILVGLGGLRRYMSWQRLVYLKDTTNLRLIAFYLQIQERYSNIYRTLRQNLTMMRK